MRAPAPMQTWGPMRASGVDIGVLRDHGGGMDADRQAGLGMQQGHRPGKCRMGIGTARQAWGRVSFRDSGMIRTPAREARAWAIYLALTRNAIWSPSRPVQGCGTPNQRPAITP
jgi:hypothetical protein